jgi:hypothetical protein
MHVSAIVAAKVTRATLHREQLADRHLPTAAAAILMLGK